MLNGRHLILLGGIAAAGLVSVREGQRQIELCYKIATVEKEVHAVQSEIKLCKNEHMALQSPKAAMDHATELRLSLAPIPPGGQTAVVPPPPSSRSNSSTSRRAPAAPPPPAIPALPVMPQEHP